MNKQDLIQKWLFNELSKEEQKAFDAMEEATFYKRIVDDAASFRASQFSSVPDFENFKEGIISPDPRVKKLHWFRPMLRVASAVMVVFGLYYFFLFNQSTEVQTLVAEKTTIELPDQSRVVLNAGSEISYNDRKWGNTREIKLEGEAFFDVAKGAQFDVITAVGTVSVLGTAFNVKQRDTFFEVACFEGTVQVVAHGQTKILNVGDNVRFFDDEIETGKQNYEEPYWTKNMSNFDRVPVSEVFAELQRQYNINVTLDNVNGKQMFTGGFVHDNLESASKAISAPMGLDFKILKRGEVRFSKGE